MTPATTSAGAKGIGPKTAVALLNTFGSVDNIYFAIDNGEESDALKPAQLASLEELRPRLDVSPGAGADANRCAAGRVGEVFKPRVSRR